MSLRQRSRLLQQNAVEATVSSEEEDDEEEAYAPPARNPFDLLNDNGDDDEEVEEEANAQRAAPRNPFDMLAEEDHESADDDEEQREGRSSVVEEAPSEVPNVTKSKNKKKKKNKKKDKSKTNSAANEEEGEDEDNMDDLEKLCKQIESAGASGPSQAGTQVEEELPHACERRILLAADLRHIKAEDELKRIFGRRVIASESAAMKAEERKAKGIPFMPRGSQQRQQKKSILLVPREHWPRMPSGISMEVTGSQDGVRLYRYTHNHSYLQVQQEYEDCLASHDPNTLAQLVAKNPYHVDGLLSLAEIYLQMNELQKAQDLLERCLFSLECAWHPNFAPQLGASRLPYSEAENRPFYAAAFKHIQSLGRRGCHRSALEVCKLVLSLDPQDPMGVLCCMDYYALMAEQYAFIPRLVEEFDSSDRSLALRPGVAFSLALARFRLQEGERANSGKDGGKASKGGDKSEGPPGGGKGVSGETRGGSGATEMLREALLLHPSCVNRLIEKLNEKSNAVTVDREWTRILALAPFTTKDINSPSLDRLVSIFIERHFLLWRPPEIQAWLKLTCAAIVDEVANSEGSSGDGGSFSDWAAVCAGAFPLDVPDEYTHLPVSAFSDAISILPPEENPFAQPP
eukprot:CAMPEP_0198219544 /NCGR_PEP_ID=MMETSP1445-20131203/74885_1 /TAXON_ID=36898 /ORGANISM="Pyramimonas sp., Strain CCMP2087" /LENGTH=629 /DNA_ID=CAMNT_0043896981 /DNA_START=95 /DNA_END=1981 /DNA_ORIENTATION=-